MNPNDYRFNHPRYDNGRLMVAPNGMNLSKSVDNPRSRLIRILDYIRRKNDAGHFDITRRELVLNVLNPNADRSTIRGYGCYVFSLAVGHGFLTYSRKGRTCVYALTDKADYLLSCHNG